MPGSTYMSAYMIVMAGSVASIVAWFNGPALLYLGAFAVMMVNPTKMKRGTNEDIERPRHYDTSNKNRSR